MIFSPKKYAPMLLCACLCCLLCACNDDDGGGDPDHLTRPSITLVTSTGGMGDSGYNDLILDGIMEFVTRHDVTFSIVTPNSVDEALREVGSWNSRGTAAEKSLLILASSEYDALLAGGGSFPQLEPSKSVLMFESDRTDLPDNVYSFSIQRYGASYLSGKMAQEARYAYVVAAYADDAMLQPAIEGFGQGYSEDTDRQAEVHYLAEDASGYNSPEKAYSYADGLPLGAFVYPLAGGSNNGIYKHAREQEFAGLLVAGMDVDCSGFSSRTPFSVIVNIDQIIIDTLEDWYEGTAIAQHRSGGLADGWIEIAIFDGFLDGVLLWEDYYADPLYWRNNYEKYYDAAIDAERRYYEE